LENFCDLGHAFIGAVLERVASSHDGHTHQDRGKQSMLRLPSMGVDSEAGAIYPKALLLVLLVQLIFNRCSPTTVQRTVPVETPGSPSSSYNSPFTLEIPLGTEVRENTNSDVPPLGTTTRDCQVYCSRLISLVSPDGTIRHFGQTTWAYLRKCDITIEIDTQIVFVPLTPDQVSSIQ